MKLFTIFFGAMIVNNILLIRFLGLCPFFGISNKLENAVSMTWAVTFVMAMASLVTWGLYHFLLLPLGLVFLRTAFFILAMMSPNFFVPMSFWGMGFATSLRILASLSNISPFCFLFLVSCFFI